MSSREQTGIPSGAVYVIYLMQLRGFKIIKIICNQPLTTPAQSSHLSPIVNERSGLIVH